MAEDAAEWFSAWNGFGFITPDAVGNDALIHISAVEHMGVVIRAKARSSASTS